MCLCKRKKAFVYTDMYEKLFFFVIIAMLLWLHNNQSFIVDVDAWMYATCTTIMDCYCFFLYLFTY